MYSEDEMTASNTVSMQKSRIKFDCIDFATCRFKIFLGGTCGVVWVLYWTISCSLGLGLGGCCGCDTVNT